MIFFDVSEPLGQFHLPITRFEHVHLIGLLPSLDGYRYCLTAIDSFTKWSEVFPVENQKAGSVARGFYAWRVCRYRVPLRVTTDKGRQFESRLFKSLCVITGTTQFRITAYHPQANSIIERLHWQLKATIKCPVLKWWTETSKSSV